MIDIRTGGRSRLLLTTIGYLAAGIIPVLAIYCRLKLTGSGLVYPLSYYSDALLQGLQIRPVIDGEPWGHISRLAAPFHHNIYLFPVGSRLDYWIACIAVKMTGHIGIALNCSFLIKVALASMIAVWSLRRLGVFPAAAWVAGILFSLLPYSLERHMHHYNLSIHLVPIMVLLAIRMLQGELGRMSRTVKIFCFVMCLAVGYNGPYTAFFSCYVFSVAFTLNLLLGRWRNALPAALAIFLIMIAGIVQFLPTRSALEDSPGARARFSETRGYNTVNTWGLHLRHLVLPVKEHPVPAIRDIMGTVEKIYPHQWTLRTAALGIFGIIGFVYLLLVLMTTGIRNPTDLDRILLPAAVINLASILLGVVGGFSNLFAVFVSDAIRSYTRISTFIGFVSIFCTALLLGRLCERVKTSASWVKKIVVLLLLMIILFMGIFDQIYALTSEVYRKNQRILWDQVKTFTRRVEAKLPTNAMVYQFPNQHYYKTKHANDNFPHLRAYLQSDDIKWSYTPLNPTDQAYEWHRDLNMNKGWNLVRLLLLAGFDGVWIDTVGYEDRGVGMTSLFTRLPRAEVLYSKNMRYVFVNMTQIRKDLMEKLGRDKYLKMQEAVLVKPFLPDTWKKSFQFGKSMDSSLKLIDGWGWIGADSAWTIVNEKFESIFSVNLPDGDNPVTMRVEAQAFLDKKACPFQDVHVYSGGKKLDEWNIEKPGVLIHETYIPDEMIGDDGSLTIRLHIPTATTYEAAGISPSKERTALRVLRIDFHCGFEK